eukprot:jgi/Mesen1/1873/ME000143S00927
MADVRRQGYLGLKEFITAMQIISLAQTGHEIHADVLRNIDPSEVGPPMMAGLDEAIEGKETAKSSSGSGSESYPLGFTPPPHLFSTLARRMKSVVQKAMGRPSSFSSSSHKDRSTSSLSASSSDAYFDEPTGAPQPMITPVPLQKPGWFSKPPRDKWSSQLQGRHRSSISFTAAAVQVQQGQSHVDLHPHSSLLTDSDFDSAPMVMLLGQNGADERSVPGNTVAVQADMPFSGLTRFGSAFLSKFEVSQLPHPLLEHVSFVDTPGVLSGEKQRTQRSYDFEGVTGCDLILLLFDPHKLDISDEFKRVIGSLHAHPDKIRVVLNKADQVDTQQVRAAAARLGGREDDTSAGDALVAGGEVKARSFSDKPMREEAGQFGQELFDMEQGDLLQDLKDIPRKSCDRKINEFVKRARAARINAFIIAHLKAQMPSMMGKAKAQQKLIDNLPDEFAKIQREHHLPAGDFPRVDYFQEVLQGYNFDKFEKLKPKLLQDVDQMLGYDIPELLRKFRNPYG